MEEKKVLLADSFTGKYPVSKTLRFELKPIGKTRQYIEENGILDTDIHRSESYKKVKKIIDRYHQKFIEESLKDLVLTDLDKFYELYSVSNKTPAQVKELESLQVLLRKQIVVGFKNNPKYKNLFKKELIEKDLLEYCISNSEEEKMIREFKGFTTYFSGFHKNRENMYSADAKSTGIAYRLIHQNLLKYMDNMQVFEKIKDTSIVTNFSELLSSLQKKISISLIEEYFNIDGFNKVLTQSGIDAYNLIVGGYTDDGNNKIQGLNEYINLYNQKIGGKTEKKIPLLKPLFKQILSDREKLSFLSEQFTTDEELINTINEYYESFKQEVLYNEEYINVEHLLLKIDTYCLDGIYIKNDSSITDIAQALYGDWSYISTAINWDYDNKSKVAKKNTEKYAERKKKDLNAIKRYSIKSLNVILNDYYQKEHFMEEYFINRGKIILENILTTYQEYFKIYGVTNATNKALCKDDQSITVIKNLLDAIKELQHILKCMVDGQEETNKDNLFYSELLRLWEAIDVITPLYNQVRNYVTKKPYSMDKVKLNFNKDTLLNGWDKNKERDNLGLIFLKEEMYYLGIMNRQHTKIMEEAPGAVSDNIYQKMEYKLLPGPNKMLPKVFFSKSRYEDFLPSEELLKKYHEGTHTKGDNFDIDDCHSLINFYKASIAKHEDWSKYDFSFSETSTYNDISGFYREVEQQGYKLSFQDIDAEYIDKLVEQGKLYLFQIYNKDFSPYSTGKPNLHTLYWKMLFDERNLADVVYKLNGQAEIFYRKASIEPENIIKHVANEPVQNKDPMNEKTESIFDYDLIKDRRFTCDKFQFHVPITMNFKATGGQYLNRKLNNLIATAKDMHVIGIDRGERNLLYLTVIDMDGNIKEQISLNTIISHDADSNKHVRDYHQLLDAREKENKKSRQNWQTVNSIKELKEGYLSQVIHVICQLMIKYNAIIVLEDLNFGFMRGRQKFEKQVYQKFEKMLIDKLNYYVDKDKDVDDNGGLLHAYQLTDKFESFQNLGKQSGFLYYVPAWNTSKLDPTTGFVNLFYVKYESKDKAKEFISKFEDIRYNEEKKYFEFVFDYSKFTHKAEQSKKDWIICSYGNRIENFRNPQQNNEWDARTIDLTREFIQLFDTYNINYKCDLQNTMLNVDDANFYKTYIRLFKLILQMRNSNAKTGEDWLISPVMNKNGEFFLSGADETKPLDADANGAYNIARKGLWIIEKIKNASPEERDNIKLAISNAEWLKYAQEHTL